MENAETMSAVEREQSEASENAEQSEASQGTGQSKPTASDAASSNDAASASEKSGEAASDPSKTGISPALRPRTAGDWEGNIRKVGPTCDATGKELEPGDEFVSLLRFGAEGIERIDLCLEAYDEADPAEFFAFWRAKVALPEANRPRPLDLNFLTEFFRRLQSEGENAQQREVAYIVSLLLIRRKVLVIYRSEEATEERPETMFLKFAKSEDDEEFKVLVPELSEEKMEAIRDDLGRIFNLDGKAK